VVALGCTGAVAMVEKAEGEDFCSESGSGGGVVSPARFDWSFCDAFGSEGRL
jgi:hypothetical protein